MEPLTAALIGYLGGLGSAPLLFVFYQSLYSASESIDQSVDNDPEGDG